MQYLPPKLGKYEFKSIPKTNPSATVSKPPDEPQSNQENAIQFDLQPLEEAPSDDALIKLLETLEANNQMVTPQAPQQAVALQEQKNTMNINNVNNVQNVTGYPNQPPVPTMYFGGNSNVTINYNFGPNK